MTKCDILAPDMLLNSILVVLEDLNEMQLFRRDKNAIRDQNKRQEEEGKDDEMKSHCIDEDNEIEDNEEELGHQRFLNGVKVEEMFSKVIPVSSSTGAGIQYLWEELNKLAIQTSKPIVSSNGEENPRAVREHVKAYVLRKREFLETKLKLTKQKKGTKKVFKGNQY